MNGIFGNGIAFDCTIFEEWDRESLISEILSISDLYSQTSLQQTSISDLQQIIKSLKEE